MGRPLNKKYLGYRNPGTDGNFGTSNTAGDADLGGQAVTGLNVGTAGSYTGTQVAALTLTYPTPALSTEGAVTATGAPLFKYLSGSTLTGTQTVAYTTGAGTLAASIGSTSITFTPTLTSYSGFSIGSVTTGGVVTLTGGTITAIKGTSITFDAGLTGTTGLTAGATYYVTASVSSSTTVTLASTYALAVAGTAITIAGGTPTGTLTLTIGTTYASVTSIALVSGGTGITAAQIAAAITTPLALTQSTSSGAGATLTSTAGSSNFGVTSGTVVNAGSGYLNLALTPSIKATTITSIASGSYGTITVSNTTGSITLGTAQSAGTFYVGQVVSFTGSAGGTGVFDTSYSTGNSYVVSVTDGTTNLTLVKINGTGLTGGTAAAVTGLTIVLYTTTLSTVDEVVAGMIVTPASTVGGLTGSTAYYVIGTPNVNTNTVSLSASLGGNSVVQTTTTAQNVATTTNSNLNAIFTGSGTTAVATTTLTTVATTGFTGRYSAIQSTAWLANGTRAYELADIISQKATRRFKVEAGADGIGVCTLVTTTPLAAGQMWIVATDSAGGTYYVDKMTARKVTLVPGGANPGTQFTVAGSAGTTTAQWIVTGTTGFVTSAVQNVSVVVDNG